MVKNVKRKKKKKKKNPAIKKIYTISIKYYELEGKDEANIERLYHI